MWPLLNAAQCLFKITFTITSQVVMNISAMEEEV